MDREKFSDFQPFLNLDFDVAVSSGVPQLALKLVEVTDLSARFPTPPEFRDPFSLLFLGPPDRPLQQGQYTLKHLKGTAFELFLVPVGLKGEEGLLYETTLS
jgi:hypothetical protein